MSHLLERLLKAEVGKGRPTPISFAVPSETGFLRNKATASLLLAVNGSGSDDVTAPSEKVYEV